MASEEPEGRRLAVRRLFNSAIRDDNKVNSPRLATLFIQGVCAFENPIELADQIVQSPRGLNAVGSSVRHDLSVDFINNHASKLLAAFSDPAIAAIDSGKVLTQVVIHLLRPGFFWSACARHLKSRALNTQATHQAAWLLSQALRLLPASDVGPYVEHVHDKDFVEPVLTSESSDVRRLGHELQWLARELSDGNDLASSGPGGRHDNDHRNIRNINIMPTTDEILSPQPAFLRAAEEVFKNPDLSQRRRIYTDHLFRVLREDMVHDIRDKLKDAKNEQKPRRAVRVPNVIFRNVESDDLEVTKPWHLKPLSICFQSGAPLPGLVKMSVKERFAFLNNTQGPGSSILRHDSLAAIMTRDIPIGYGFIVRKCDDLSLDSARMTLRLDEDSLDRFFTHVAQGDVFDILILDTAVFAYEPVLQKLQHQRYTDLFDMLVDIDSEMTVEEPSESIDRLTEAIISNNYHDIRAGLSTEKPLTLDPSQRDALLSGIMSKVSVIQGPPGTGKSFIGALIAKALYENLDGTIMVVCFTNHALDQFVGDLIDVGLPESGIVRLGSKCSERTRSLQLRNKAASSRLSRYQWESINENQGQMMILKRTIDDLQRKFKAPVSTAELLQHLEFLEDSAFFDGLSPPHSGDGMTQVGVKGKTIGQAYLLKRWLKGDRHSPHMNDEPTSIWNIPVDERRRLYDGWQRDLRETHLDHLKTIYRNFNQCQEMVRNIFTSKDSDTIAAHRIVACTSTYAAKSANMLSRVRPEVLLLEEAGELLEAHVAASIGDFTKRLIMIGDHKQLRPKTLDYKLSVEAHQGYDLNRSLFERLVINGLPHVSLSKQHRMRPEISAMVRHLTYPNLEDADSTLHRPDIRGLQKNVVFVNHNEAETAHKHDSQQQSDSSKQNLYEAELTLRYVKYLAQQGYGSDDMIVLTPYLGQLRTLRDTLSKENDPVLNDLDNHDLCSAGLVDDTKSAQSRGRRIDISSIDNYQGEEKKIVIVSLTRSNESGAIGFMAEPERLNVLLSRARDGLIVIGNFGTFTASPKGATVWKSLINFVKEQGHFFQGLPVQCQSHPQIQSLVVKPSDFLDTCPDGGCNQACQVMLTCGRHKCPSRCHILQDHSNIICSEVVTSKCPAGHTQRARCQSGVKSDCSTCKKLADKQRRLDQEKLAQKKIEEESQTSHDFAMEAIETEIANMRRGMTHSTQQRERQSALLAKKAELEDVRAQLLNASSIASAASNTHADSKGQEAAPLAPQNMATPNGQNPSLLSSNSKIGSSAEREWERQKKIESQSNKAIDELMQMVGLESIKQHILDIKGHIEVKKRQGVNISGERLHVAFLGNPGTGKTTVARLWCRLLNSLGVIKGDAFEETSGSKLATGGVPAAQAHLDNIAGAEGGVLFVDEAYQLTSGASSSGKHVLDFLLGEIENRRGNTVFVFAGYKQPMESFFSHNPGIPSRIPHQFNFDDYTQQELLTLLQKLFERKFTGRAKIEDGLDGLYMRIATRRLERQSGMEGFGNMRDLENVFDRICSRQARRVCQIQRTEDKPDLLAFVKEDLIGPEPSAVMLQSAAWNQLQDFIGLEAVKESIKTLVGSLRTNYLRELKEEKPIQISLNKVFLGSPGTGKTSVAKLYGQLLAEIGMLSSGDVVSKTPTDFIGSALGQSESATAGILETSKGKVLIIDEAYMLDPYQSEEGSGSLADPYRTAVIDTIVSLVHNVPGDDRCVLLLGYEDKMEAMFRKVNPGFSRRFPLEDAFRFEDFNDAELEQILDQKLRTQDLIATPSGRQTAMRLLGRERKLMNFGNAGAVENMISRAKVSRQKRLSPDNDSTFDLDAIDFDPDFDRSQTAKTRLEDMFNGVVGADALIAQLRRYQNIAANVVALGRPAEEQVPFNFVFKGPPGTGKTSTARKIGQVYYDMGLLQRVEVVECSVSDMVGQYVGQTGPKTRKLLEKALGKVLFVDEAYRLGNGHFATEAVDELTDLLTKPMFKGKLVIVLAGYENEMDHLMSVNPGLESRFPETINFHPLSAEQSMDLFAQHLQRNEMKCSSFDATRTDAWMEILEIFKSLARLRSWASGRDIEDLSRKTMRHIFGCEPGDELDSREIPHEVVVECLTKALHARQKSERQARSLSSDSLNDRPPFANDAIPPIMSPPQISTTATKKIVTEAVHEESEDENALDSSVEQRDDGVPDEIWRQLEVDKTNALAREKQDATWLSELEASTTQAQEEVAKATTAEEAALLEAQDDNTSGGSDSEDDAEAEARRGRLRALEAARLERSRMLQAQQRARDALEQERKRQEAERKKEAVAQRKLRDLGVCCMGFRWIKQADGYRCAGGSHFVTNAQLDASF